MGLKLKKRALGLGNLILAGITVCSCLQAGKYMINQAEKGMYRLVNGKDLEPTDTDSKK